MELRDNAACCEEEGNACKFQYRILSNRSYGTLPIPSHKSRSFVCDDIFSTIISGNAFCSAVVEVALLLHKLFWSWVRWSKLHDNRGRIRR